MDSSILSPARMNYLTQWAIVPVGLLVLHRHDVTVGKLYKLWCSQLSVSPGIEPLSILVGHTSPVTRACMEGDQKWTSLLRQQRR